MKIKYILTETNYDGGAPMRIGYGVAATLIEDGCAVILQSANNLTPEKSKAQKLVQSCNKCELSIKHFHDVVEDFLT